MNNKKVMSRAEWMQLILGVAVVFGGIVRFFPGLTGYLPRIICAAIVCEDHLTCNIIASQETDRFRDASPYSKGFVETRQNNA